jgi:hypothetical protein
VGPFGGAASGGGVKVIFSAASVSMSDKAPSEKALRGGSS